MQRLFSSFPTGGPGLGLLVLRIAAGALLVLHSRPAFDGDLQSIIVGSVAVISAVLLAAGFLTPFAGIAGAVAAVIIGDVRLSGCLVAIGAAVVLLGPGGYSVDSRLFGRREIVIDGQN